MADIEDLITQMTLEEKISVLAGKDLWHTVPVSRLGIPSIRVTDGPNGARGSEGSLAPTSALIPVGIALGATWNTELVERIGKLLADETRIKGSHILLAPTVNIHRTPIAGRNFECFAEDPYLSGMLASAYINGIQSKGIGACIKHFVCNDQEYQRNSMSSNVEERPLREIYLEPFRLALKNAKPWSFMSGYNRVNGFFASENDHTVKDILKGEWGFDGLLMSDWFGTYTPRVPAGGLDLEMPGPARWMSDEMVRKALSSGDLTEHALDDKVRRLLLTIQRAGAFENPELQPDRSADLPEHRALIRETARETIVLLKNDKDILPLDVEKQQTIAVIGELARWPNLMGGGSSGVSPHYQVSPFEGIRRYVDERANVEYATGAFIHKNLPSPDLSTVASEDGKPGLTLRIYDNLDFSGKPAFERTTTDRLGYGWFDDSVPNVNQERFSARITGFFTPAESGMHTLGLASMGQSKLILGGETIVDNWTTSVPNTEQKVRKQLEGGRTYPLTVEFRWEGNRVWRAVRIGHLPPQPADDFAEAIALAKRADVVIVVAGLTGEWEAEGYDRVDMDLPGNQDELIEKVAAANPNTIVVLNAGSPVTMPWIDKVAAVVEQWYNSQECGNALADVLFGEVSPSGKLPTTFPKRLKDNPASINYPGENSEVLYGEGLFVGYRYYDAKEIDPLFPFGFGLSYTSFEYSNLQFSETRFTEEQTVEVSLDVRNTGARTGKEIVQLYVRDIFPGLVRPEKELKAFAKVELAPGETKTVRLSLDREAFWYYNPARNGWVVEPGKFEILVGASSRDLRLSGQVTVLPNRGDDRLNTGMTLRTILSDGAGRAVFQKHFSEWMATPDLQHALDLTVDAIATKVPHVLTPVKLAALAADLDEA
jgi:beta-glucosidase